MIIITKWTIRISPNLRVFLPRVISAVAPSAGRCFLVLIGRSTAVPTQNKTYTRCTHGFFWGLTVFSIIWLIGWTRQEIRNPGFALCIGEFIGLVILFVGLQGALITISQLYNPRSKLLWTRTSVFGVPLVRTILTSGRRLQMELSWNNRPEIPISVVEYFKVTTWQAGSMTQAVQVFQSVIIELLARGVIQVYQYQHYTSRGWGKFKPVGSVYIFLPMQ